jgi:hypothetical protein
MNSFAKRALPCCTKLRPDEGEETERPIHCTVEAAEEVKPVGVTEAAASGAPREAGRRWPLHGHCADAWRSSSGMCRSSCFVDALDDCVTTWGATRGGRDRFREPA